jgi:hypothetical protein
MTNQYKRPKIDRKTYGYPQRYRDDKTWSIFFRNEHPENKKEK